MIGSLTSKTNFVRHYLDDLEDDRILRLLRFGLRLLNLMDEDLDDDLDEPNEYLFLRAEALFGSTLIKGSTHSSPRRCCGPPTSPPRRASCSGDRRGTSLLIRPLLGGGDEGL